MNENIKIYKSECIETMNKYLKNNSIDLIICDLPYGTTACKWDVIIPFDELWEQYERIIKDDGVIVLFGSEPFSSHLRLSNLKLYKYDIKWVKNKASNHINCKFQPLKNYEDILIFSKSASTYSKRGNMKYNPQGLIEIVGGKIQNRVSNKAETFHSSPNKKTIQKMSNYPKSILEFGVVMKPQHPTQKPVELIEYLIKTYSDEGDLVLDNCMGSGTSGVACINTNRRFIGIEKEDKYFEIAEERISNLL